MTRLKVGAGAMKIGLQARVTNVSIDTNVHQYREAIMLHKKGDIQIAARLSRVRNDVGYSQAKVAAITDVSNSTYKNYEAARRDPQIGFVRKFCEVFDVSFDWLLSGKGQPKQRYFDVRFPPGDVIPDSVGVEQ